MSGHSKWHNIRIRKGKQDAIRGKQFTKITREIIVAAKQGGGNPDANPTLKKTIEKAKEINMPQDTIKKAILRGTGELEGVSYEHCVVEGYGPGGVAIFIEALTDNKQRTIADIRHIFSKCNGNLGEAGCVSWLFKKKGVIIVDKENIDEDEIISIALDAGAEDVETSSSSYEITTLPENFEKVKNYLKEKKINFSSAEITMVPQNTIKLEGKEAVSVLKLMETLEENDDVQQVYANFDIPDNIMEEEIK